VTTRTFPDPRDKWYVVKKKKQIKNYKETPFPIVSYTIFAGKPMFLLKRKPSFARLPPSKIAWLTARCSWSDCRCSRPEGGEFLLFTHYGVSCRDKNTTKRSATNYTDHVNVTRFRQPREINFVFSFVDISSLPGGKPFEIQSMTLCVGPATCEIRTNSTRKNVHHVSVLYYIH